MSQASKAIVSVAALAAGCFCMWLTNGQTGLGLGVFAVLVVWMLG